MTILEFFGFWILVCIIAIALTMVAGLVWTIIDIVRILKRDDTEEDDL